MASDDTQQTRFSEKHFFLIRRLHSLLGLIPVGVFLVFHLFANSMVLIPGEYQSAVEKIEALGPFLVPVEMTFIFIPLLFHALLGIAFALEGTPNPAHYRYGPNIRYTLQRISGYIAFVFIIYHVWHMHWTGAPFGGGLFKIHSETGAPVAALTTAEAIQASWWIAPFYALGIVASVYHLANGIWTALITWGITIKPRTQQVSGYVCAAFGVVLTLIGLGALTGFRNFDVNAAQPQPHASAQDS